MGLLPAYSLSMNRGEKVLTLWRKVWVIVGKIPIEFKSERSECRFAN